MWYEFIQTRMKCSFIQRIHIQISSEKQSCEREEDVTCSIQAKGVPGDWNSYPFEIFVVFFVFPFICCCWCRVIQYLYICQWCNRWTQLFANPQSLLPFLNFHPFSPFYRCALFTILWHWNILGGESQEHPPILYEFNFGSLTNASLREIERELTEVSWLSIFI